MLVHPKEVKKVVGSFRILVKRRGDYRLFVKIANDLQGSSPLTISDKDEHLHDVVDTHSAEKTYDHINLLGTHNLPQKIPSIAALRFGNRLKNGRCRFMKFSRSLRFPNANGEVLFERIVISRAGSSSKLRSRASMGFNEPGRRAFHGIVQSRDAAQPGS